MPVFLAFQVSAEEPSNCFIKRPWYWTGQHSCCQGSASAFGFVSWGSHLEVSGHGFAVHHGCLCGCTLVMLGSPLQNVLSGDSTTMCSKCLQTGMMPPATDPGLVCLACCSCAEDLHNEVLCWTLQAGGGEPTVFMLQRAVYITKSSESLAIAAIGEHNKVASVKHRRKYSKSSR